MGKQESELKAFRKGYQAFRSSRPIPNPYKKRQRYKDAWDLGWAKAKQMMEEALRRR